MITMLVLLAALAAAAAGLALFTALVARKATATIPPVGRFVTVDGLRLHYVDEGAGPVVLLIHGLSSQLQNFTYALSAELRGRHRLLILDRPGNGYSQAAASATLTAQADIVAGFLGALGVEKAVVLGHSLGGAVALALALDHPERVAALALVAPASQPQEAPPAALRGLALRSAAARWIVGWFVAVPLGLAARSKTMAALFAPDPVAPRFATRAGAMLSMRPWAFRNASRDLVEAGGQLAAYAARQGELRMPVGVLFGTGDRILDHRHHGEALAAKVPGLDLELVDGGHMIPLTQPARTAAFVDRMAARAAPPPPPSALADDASRRQNGVRRRT